MNKKGQTFLNLRTIIYTLGGAFLGTILANRIELIIIGGLIGFIISITWK